jgi:outer membrane protein OmpA-like peptidoglycan-associated protein
MDELLLALVLMALNRCPAGQAAPASTAVASWEIPFNNNEVKVVRSDQLVKLYQARDAIRDRLQGNARARLAIEGYARGQETAASRAQAEERVASVRQWLGTAPGFLANVELSEKPLVARDAKPSARLILEGAAPARSVRPECVSRQPTLPDIAFAPGKADLATGDQFDKLFQARNMVIARGRKAPALLVVEGHARGTETRANQNLAAQRAALVKRFFTSISGIEVVDRVSETQRDKDAVTFALEDQRPAAPRS